MPDRYYEEGYFVARLRPDQSYRTWWPRRLESSALDDPLLESCCPSGPIGRPLLQPRVIDELWMQSPVRVSAERALLDGQHSMTATRGAGRSGEEELEAS